MKQIHIANAVGVSDVRRITNVLINTKQLFNLFDNTETSKVDKTLYSMTEGEKQGFGFGARIVNNLIIIDCNARGTVSPKFVEIYQHMFNELSLAFPNGVREVTGEACVGLYSMGP